MIYRRITRILVLMAVFAVMLATIVSATFTIKVTYSSGGTVAPTNSSVQLENGQIVVEDSSPITLVITPNDGYTIHSVFRDGEQMDISGESQQSLTVVPRADVDVQVVFLPVEGVSTEPEEEVPDKPTINPVPEEEPQNSDNVLDTPSDGVDSNPQEYEQEIDWQKIIFIGAIIGAAIITVLIMARMFFKRGNRD